MGRDQAPDLYGTEHRQHAQEVISAFVSRDAPLLDVLLSDYGDDLQMLNCFLDLILVAVLDGDASTGQARFEFQQWMLGGVLVALAERRGLQASQLAVEVLDEDVCVGFGSVEQVRIRAAQTALVSHLQARAGSQPWGIVSALDGVALDQLTIGSHMLIWLLCWRTSEEVGPTAVIRILLPHTQRILQMGADAEQVPLAEFLQRFWMQHLLRDCEA